MLHKQTPPSSLPGPEDIHRAVLPNGMVVLSRQNFNSPSVVISGYLLAGSLFDPEQKLGLADFTASALLRGSQERDFQQIFEALESCGASLSVGAGMQSAGFNGRCLAEDLPLLLDLFADAILRPDFPAGQVEKLRAQRLTGLAIRAQDTADMAGLTFDKIIYEGHPYARPEDGWPETIRAISRDDLAGFHRDHYGPRGMVISIVGAVDAPQALGEVARVLGDWRNPRQPADPVLPPLQPLVHETSRRVVIPGKSQCDLVIGAAGPRRLDPEYFPAALGNSALGQFGMMGRIGEVVREKAGLAYYAGSSLNAGIGPGSWEISAGVNPSNVGKAIDLIRRELREFHHKGITADELADNQANFIGRLPLSLESNGGVAGALLNIERYGLGMDFYRRYPDLVRAVTTGQVRQAARKFLDPERLALAVAGPGEAGS